MSRLFTKRRQRHFMMLLKYWRLVFNDHFVIALFFLFGALAYGYSEWLPTLSANQWWPRFLLIAWFVLLAQIGRLATLIKRPDPVFLLPQVRAMDGYLRRAYLYSLVLAGGMTLAGTFAALPFALTTERLSTVDIVAVFLTAVVTKDDWLFTARKSINLRWSKQGWRTQAEYWLNPLLAAAVTWLVSPLLGLAVAVILDVAMRLVYRELTIDWQAAVKMESNRMYSVYRFFNLFTDVPSVQGNVKRRRWANGLVRWLSNGHRPWAYLYARGFVRNTDISGIVIRLTLLGMVLAFLVPLQWLNTALVVLFIYLIATQLMPLYGQYDANVLTHLYPVQTEERVRDFQRLLIRVTVIEATLIVLASIGLHFDWRGFLLNLVLAIIEVGVLTRFYFKLRIKKLSEEY
ncbi:ABC transporter permease [Limosilactobacillus oris]|uniref:ABC transporter permease n=1 Tax=Limosilactobacillus oris TaxID=1632 RepID=UPI0018832D22|nr:ABC transporter permease [Limosilactobacillus oris]MBF0601033.1 ABC transporter permease [Limosilactobacillus oris]WHO84993.1 ABC transporter permease [Limosilactobacillus oris]